MPYGSGASPGTCSRHDDPPRLIQKGGVEDGEDIVVDVPSWYVGLALEAADEMGLIRGEAPPKG